MKTWVKVVLVILAIIVIAAIVIFVMGTIKGKNEQSTLPSSNPSASNYTTFASDEPGFDLMRKSLYYTAYFHKDDLTNADKTLTVLDKAVTDSYKKYYGITPQNTSVYLTQTVDEYVKVADFPGGAANVQVGDGSAPSGKIYLYKPFEDSQKGKGVIVHEGAHAALWGFFGGGEKMAKLPGFLNEGMAYHVEYINNAGADYDPSKEIYFTDLLKKAANTGNPALMSLDELGKNCEGYISDETRNGLCRGQGTFTVWYLAKNYGVDFWAKFLADLKTSGEWQKSLEKISGKSISQLGQEIDSALKSQTQ